MIRNFTILFFFSFILFISNSNAQGRYCGSARYDQEVYSTVVTHADIPYGSNTDYTGATVNLTMDIYEPTADTAIMRPLIVWVHGGSFIGGTKNDIDVVSLSNHFAKRGYVCASINYRLGMAIPPNQTNATQAVFRAVQDMKAAIRFFRKDAATSNTYKIDPDMIFGAGSSAGAFTALHLAYLNQPNELPSFLDTMVLGGMEGNSGNPGYRSDVNAIVNLCGALGDINWMVPGDIPVCSMHGTADQVVPYGTAMLYLLNTFAIMVVNGSHSISQHANSIRVPNVMYTYFGQGHVPYAGTTPTELAIMDTTVRFVSNFLYRTMGCTPADPTPLPNTFPLTQVSEKPPLQKELVTIRQDKTVIFINGVGTNVLERVSLHDLSGRMLMDQEVDHVSMVALTSDQIAFGIYLLYVYSRDGNVAIKVIFH